MMNKYRKYVTSSVAFACVVVAVTGVTFKLLFKNHTLEEIHGWIGLGLVAAAIFHIAQNWNPLKSYLRDWRVLGLAVPIVLVIAVISFGQQRESGERINPREIAFKLSKASANDLAKVFGKDVNTVFAAMKSDGLRVGDSGETAQELARDNKTSPEWIVSYFEK
jgi:hypothetical protein